MTSENSIPELADIRSAEIVLPCSELEATLDFFTARLGFAVQQILPADKPVVAVISGHGIRIRLDLNATQGPGQLRLNCTVPDQAGKQPTILVAPNGTRIELANANPSIEMPEEQQSFVLTRQDENAVWVTGRAGMRYRDLIPGRQGGRFIASHIQIQSAGPVPDYVHYHQVRFQLIYCYQGWVRVVYEDQGEPFVLRAGDCVLQPPGIRHRVLESSEGLEVIEVGCPADHRTHADPEMSLPTRAVAPERYFEGQRFVRHQADSAIWQPWRIPGLECRDSGIGAATDGLASVQVVRPSGPVKAQDWVSHDGEFLFLFLLSGSLSLLRNGLDQELLRATDACVIPRAMQHAFAECSGDLEFLEVRLPADL
jgi:quercetin dioxygenase-like cupin family protein